MGTSHPFSGSEESPCACGLLSGFQHLMRGCPLDSVSVRAEMLSNACHSRASQYSALMFYHALR